MNSEAISLRAPQGAIAWTAVDGWVYRGDRVPTTEETGDLVLVVSDDDYLRGVAHYHRAPLATVHRIDADLADVVQRINDLTERAQGLDTGLAVEVSMLKARVRQLENRGQL